MRHEVRLLLLEHVRNCIYARSPDWHSNTWHWSYNRLTDLEERTRKMLDLPPGQTWSGKESMYPQIDQLTRAGLPPDEATAARIKRDESPVVL